MTNAMVTYLGPLVGAVFMLAHLAIGWWKMRRCPQFLGLLATFLSGGSIVSGMQLGAIVLRPPAPVPETIRVDDYRITLTLGALGFFAVTFWGFSEVWKSLKRPTAIEKSDDDRKGPNP